MTERIPVFSEEVLVRLRGTLTNAVGVADFWQTLPSIRLRILLATVMNPEFARSFFSDEVAAVRAWAHDGPESLDAQAVYQVARLFCQLVTDEQNQDNNIKVALGFDALLDKLDNEELPDRFTALADEQPLVLVLRGLSGSGKSSLAELIQRTGMQSYPHVGLLSSDIYHCKIGRDRESKRSIYRTEDGQAIAVDPIFSDDPVSDARPLLWKNAFREDFERLSRECRIIVVDGGYGELLLDELGVLASQRLLIEVALDSQRRFANVVARANHFQSPAATRVKIMNDMILSIGWFSLLMENNVDPDWIVVPLPEDNTSAALARRTQQLGRDPEPRQDQQSLLRQVNIAREPGTEPLTPEELHDCLIRLFVDSNSITPEVIVNKNAVEIHTMIPDDLQARISIPQLQRIVRYHCFQQSRTG